jgi:hypothetical protein
MEPTFDAIPPGQSRNGFGKEAQACVRGVLVAPARPGRARLRLFRRNARGRLGGERTGRGADTNAWLRRPRGPRRASRAFVPRDVGIPPDSRRARSARSASNAASSESRWTRSTSPIGKARNDSRRDPSRIWLITRRGAYSATTSIPRSPGHRLGIKTVQILRPGARRADSATHVLFSLHELRPLLRGD